MLDNIYLELKFNIRRKPESPEALEELKKIFREDIKSSRTEDKIRTLSDLIDVLEKRDILSKENIAPLRTIDNVLNKFFLHSPQFSVANSRTSSHKSHNINNHNERSSRISCDPGVKAKVYATIASELGRNWTTFARNLYVPECLIDDLHHKSSEDRVYAVLHFYEGECDIRKWRTVLLKALIECRRKDLYEKVQFIFDTFNS